MCGRFTFRKPSPAALASFGVTEAAEGPRASFNVAPGQTVPVVVQMGDRRMLDSYRWGLVPAWAKDPSVGYKMINARGETVADKPAFRQAFLQRRCLILADGFYEWKQGTKAKVPHYFTLPHEEAFAFAGLWERWEGPDGIGLLTCTIVTVEANELMRPFHHRMPVILEPDDYGRWLDPGFRNKAALLTLLRPYPSARMRVRPVSALVNSPKNDGPQCVLPLEGEPG